MGEVLKFTGDHKGAAFSLTAKQVDGLWSIEITDFYDTDAEPDAVFNEVSDALIGIAGGLTHSAERHKPSSRGGMVCTISLFQNGSYLFSGAGMENPERKKWFTECMAGVMKHVKKHGT